ncbi:MAG: ABC transporter permease [Mesorhizobium sp.]|nr:MAG: ABC transporter permease [Mesorhizobium sp.]
MKSEARASAVSTAPIVSGPASMGRRKSLNDFLQPEWAILPVLVLVFIVGSLLHPAFLSFDNFYGVMQQTSELGVLTMGLTLVLIAGKFDLSLESTFGLAPMLGAWALPILRFLR